MKFITAVVLLLALEAVCGASVAVRLLSKQVPLASNSAQSISSYLQSTGAAALQQSNAALSAALTQSQAAAGSAALPGSVSLPASTALLGSAALLPSTSSLSAALPGSAALLPSTSSLSAASTPDSIPATPLNANSAAAAAAGSAGCSAPSPCQNPISWGLGESSTNSGLSVSDAVKPIEQWMKDFKARTSSDGTDLMTAARDTIAPMLQKLKRNQQDALEKLEESNAAILQHVDESATEHVYNILHAQKIIDDTAAAKDTQQEKINEVKAEAAEKEAESKLLAEHSEHSQSESSSSHSSSSSHAEHSESSKLS